MLFTRASEYALLASIYLSRQKEPVDAFRMADDLDISRAFLAKILQNLAKDGLLKSFKGVGGGFCLAYEPENISIMKIIESAEKRKLQVFACSAGDDCCPKDRAKGCFVWPMFHAIQGKLDEFLDTISLADMIKMR